MLSKKKKKKKNNNNKNKIGTQGEETIAGNFVRQCVTKSWNIPLFDDDGGCGDGDDDDDDDDNGHI